MYYEMMEQPEALRRTFASELDNMANISKLPNLLILFI